ncbi:MAG: calcium/sodium antiporter [Candidatus Hydrogenedentes bacterium]|nr:calcium/sodium antiporter [Candidatus Hydrogenedentota bacterium]
MLVYLLLLVGFTILIKGADWLVDGAATFARIVGISDLVIGLTIVAFGTSLPELIVSVMAAARGNTGIAIGNIVGSNIANILIIIGLAAIINPVQASKSTVRKEIPFCMLAAVLVGILPNDTVLDHAAQNYLGRIDGLVLLSFFIVFMYYIFEVIRSESNQRTDAPPTNKSTIRALLKIIAGLTSLVLGGRWVVQGAVAVAEAFNVGEDVIGLTVVAVGTSLPELATSAVAAYRKNSDIAIGNVVGSNIFNVFFVLGMTGILHPIPLDARNNIDILFMILVTLLLFLTMFRGKPRYTVHRVEGIFYLVLYACYLGFQVSRG